MEKVVKEGSALPPLLGKEQSPMIRSDGLTHAKTVPSKSKNNLLYFFMPRPSLRYRPCSGSVRTAQSGQVIPKTVPAVLF